MPQRVGRVTSLYDDGTCQVLNEQTNETWFGRLVVMSGGMICFDLVDERLQPMGHREIHPERGEATDEAKIPKRERGQHVRLGGRKKEDAAAA